MPQAWQTGEEEMIIQAGDLPVEVDTGINKPGALQRYQEGQWRDYLRDGKPVRWPVALERLESGRYRVKSSPEINIFSGTWLD
jgi:hypothetical protein